MKMNTKELEKMYNKLEEQTRVSYLKENTVLLVRSGSVVYGANTDNSDEDYKGVVMNSFEMKTGLYSFSHANTMGGKKEKTKSNEVDLSLQSLEDFTNGYAQGRFNELQMVYTNDEFYVKETELGKQLRDVYKKYSSKYAVHAFKGNVMNTLKVFNKTYEQGQGELNYKAMYQAMNYVTLGQEYLKQGYFETYTKQRAKMLQEVRKGYYTSYESFMKAVESELKYLEECYRESTLPEEYNRMGLSNECSNLYRKFYMENLTK